MMKDVLGGMSEPMVPEAAVAMLACARIGAVHSVIFGGFSPEAVAGRIIDSNSRLVITSDEGVRAGPSIPLKKNVDDALKNPNVTSVEHVVVLKRTGGKIDWQEGRDLWWHDLVEQASDQHQAEEMNAEDPLAKIDELIAATRRAADDLKKGNA